MSRTTDIQDGLKELDFRISDGIEVRLLWQPGADHVIVDVTDTSGDEAFRLEVPGNMALEVFRHPFAYAAFDGVDFGELDLQTLHT